MVTLLIILFLVGVNALYVTAEYSVVGVGRARAKGLVRQGRRGARRLDGIVSDAVRLDRSITACQIGISASSLALGAYTQVVLAPALAPVLARWTGWGTLVSGSAAVAVTLGLTSAFQIIFGEQVPKSIAVRDPGRWALATVLPLQLSTTAFAPFIAVLSGSANLLLRLFRLPVLPRHSLHSATEIGWTVSRSARAGAVKAELQVRVHNALHFTARTALDVMVPRVRVQAISDDVTMAELRKTVRESAHTRLPVYHGSLDRVVGLIHSKDVLLRTGGQGPEPFLTELLRPVPLVPGGTRAGLLLERMRAEGAALAVILDEHGGTAGIVTLEDLVEELFGEVEDEFDDTGPAIGRLPGGRIRLRGEDPVARVNADLALAIQPLEARTVGGYMMEALERVARPGDRVPVAGHLLVVERVSGRRIETVVAVPVENGEGEGGS